MKKTKRQYEKPSFKVYELKQDSHLLQSSMPISPGETTDQW